MSHKPIPTPFETLQTAAQQIDARAAIRDLPDGERSMALTVKIFNAMRGRDLTETEGWWFMVALKAARAQQGARHSDDYIDLAAYVALTLESVHKEEAR